MMSWVAFWIDPSEFGTDISVAVTSMLTLIAYRFAIGLFLPVISYLTRLALFILGGTILVFLSLVEVVFTSVLVQRQRRELSCTVDRYSRWVFPAIFVWLVVQTLYLPLPGWV
jgi:cadmium resistance protein CadD (predicted permease)